MVGYYGLLYLRIPIETGLEEADQLPCCRRSGRKSLALLLEGRTGTDARIAPTGVDWTAQIPPDNESPAWNKTRQNLTAVSSYPHDVQWVLGWYLVSG